MPDWNLLRCPVCLSGGNLDNKEWTCAQCGKSYPRFGSIIDFRVNDARLNLSFSHLETTRQENERLVRALALSQGATLAEMVCNYFCEFPTSASIRLAEERTLLRADENARAVQLTMSQVIPLTELATRDQSAFLELGCGTAGLTRTLGNKFGTAVALDADIDRMMLAQKACEESGVRNAILICAYGEQMPLAPGAFDLISAVEVLEHVTSQEQFLRCIHKTLKAGGSLYLTTPNRHSLGREPHVMLWGVGFLPRRWMNSYVQFRIGLPYEGKRNLSYWELNRLLRRFFGDKFSFCRSHHPKTISASGLMANWLGTVPVLGSAVHLIRSGQKVVAHKPVHL
jgi:2-polyprenyl-3-methyl-5-hydroxy-6-metoxy-1,4-benzoquinol methylase